MVMLNVYTVYFFFFQQVNLMVMLNVYTVYFFFFQQVNLSLTL